MKFAVPLALLILILARTPVWAQSTPAPTPPPSLDPFCDVSAAANQWDMAANARSAASASNAVVLQLYAQSSSASYADADVVLVSDSSAYDVQLRGVTLYGSPFHKFSRGLVAALPQAVQIRYVFVDAYAYDKGAQTNCATEPAALSNDRRWNLAAPISGLPPINARFKQALPQLPCGKLFSQARVLEASSPLNPYSSDSDLDTDVDVGIWLDSLGRVLKTWIYRSSGDAAIDNAATLAAIRSKYQPSLFLCSPVVGNFLFKVRFQSRRY